MPNLKILPTEYKFSFCKVYILIAAQNYNCLYTVKIRANMNWTIAQYMTRTIKNVKVDISRATSQRKYLPNIKVVQLVHVKRVCLLQPERFQWIFLYHYNWIQKMWLHLQVNAVKQSSRLITIEFRSLKRYAKFAEKCLNTCDYVCKLMWWNKASG